MMFEYIEDIKLLDGQNKDDEVYRLFFELMYAQEKNDKEVFQVGELCGMDMSKNGFISEFGIHETDSEQVLQNLRILIQNELSSATYKTISVIRSKKILCYTVFENDTDKKKLLKDLVNILEEFSERNMGISVFAGIGGTFYSLTEAPKSFCDAKTAYKIAQHSIKKVSISNYEDLGILRLLVNLHDDESIKCYCRSILKPLADKDKNGHSNYIATLDAYLDNNCNLLKTASILMIHRNTLIYRIEKIKEITGYDITYNARAKTEFMNALEIAKYYDMTDLIHQNN